MSKRSRSGGSRRRTARAAKGRGLRIPPVAYILVGVAAVVAIVVFVVMQAGGSNGNRDEARAAEADADPALPGRYVNLPEIYGGPYSETAGHVQRQVDYEADGNTNPPVGGPHWTGECGEDPSEAPPFCGPAPWGIYREPWEPETLVHNMEHAGVVVWYNTRDQTVVQQLEDLVRGRVEDDELIVLAPYAEMEPDTIALTSWSRIETFPASEYTDERVNTFIDAHLKRFNPEGF